MTKGEIRKLRKQTIAEGRPLTGELSICKNNENDSGEFFGPERFSNGKYNTRRTRALERHALRVYESA